jgi:restriction system protein
MTCSRSDDAAMKPWQEYQEEAASFFRGLKLDATTDVRLEGTRTSHDIDVAVRSTHVGFDLLWVVECKRWKSRVSRERVLALRQIVQDLGADRGILLSESGFQRGAIEAASFTNVQLTSLRDLSQATREAMGTIRLRALQDRVDDCRERYWKIDKETRIEFDLRPDVAEPRGFRSTHVLDTIDAAIKSALRECLPVDYEWQIEMPGIDLYSDVSTAPELADALSRSLDVLEGKIEVAERATRK